jgi:hypothetical protein
MKGLVLLIGVFNYSFGLIISYIFSIDESITLRATAVLVLIFAIIILLIFPRRKLTKKLTRKQRMTLYGSFYFYIIGLLSMGFVILINNGLNDMMRTYILTYGTRVLSGILLAIIVASERVKLQDMVKWIEPFCIFYTITLFYIIMQTRNSSSLSFGINRQTLAYGGAYSLCLFLYINTNFNHIKKMKIFSSRIWIIFNWIFIGFNLFTIFAGGGRGAVVLAFCVFFYYVLLEFSTLRPKQIFRALLLLFATSIGVYYLSRLEMIGIGFNAVRRLFADDFLSDMSFKERFDLYINAIEIAKKRLFIGFGIGSTAYDIGFYSHNIFLDLLVDFGLVGVLIAVILLVQHVNIVLKRGKEVDIQIVWIIFLCSFIMLLFSGTLWAETGLWFSTVLMLMMADQKFSLF